MKTLIDILILEGGKLHHLVTCICYLKIVDWLKVLELNCHYCFASFS